MDPELRSLLNPYLAPVQAHEGQTREQALNFDSRMLAYIAVTFLDWDGPLDVEEIRALLAQQ